VEDKDVIRAKTTFSLKIERERERERVKNRERKPPLPPHQVLSRKEGRRARVR
jgi:hypothetical protein